MLFFFFFFWCRFCFHNGSFVTRILGSLSFYYKFCLSMYVLHMLYLTIFGYLSVCLCLRFLFNDALSFCLLFMSCCCLFFIYYYILYLIPLLSLLLLSINFSYYCYYHCHSCINFSFVLSF